MVLNLKIGDKVIVTFPQRGDPLAEKVGCLVEWHGCSFDGIIEYVDRSRDDGDYYIVDMPGIEPQWAHRWAVHPTWVELKSGPW